MVTIRQIKKFFIHLFNLAVPLSCPLCGAETEAGFNSFCSECYRKLPFIDDTQPACPGCGGVLDSALAVCSLCLNESERPWQRGYSVLEYRDSARQLVSVMKYSNSPELARPLGNLLAKKLTELALDIDVIVPVPLHFWRQCTRGYNQSQLLAEVAGKRLGIPVVNAVKRIGLRSRQAGRNRQERHRSLKGIFALRSDISLEGKRVLLLDDVITTGATLTAVSRVVLKGKPASLQVITLARTPRKF